MLAHKGVLASAQDISAMTPTRWMFEYISLREKELEDWRRIRKMLIGMLGLDMVSKSRFPKANKDNPDVERFAPLVMFLNPMMGEGLIGEYFEDLNVESTMNPDWERKLDDPDSLIADLQVIEKPDQSVKVEESVDPGSFGYTAPPVTPKIRIDKDK